MATFHDVARIVAALPEVTEGESRGGRTWDVGGRTFAWERAFSKADLRRYGDVTPPAGPVLAVRVADLGEKEAVLAAVHRGIFTIPHFDNYAAVLVDLPQVSARVLREVLEDGWLCRAPDRLTAGFVPRS
ncbi:MAG: hypothetical protein ABI807_15175 [Sporichthyaceae bacterium]